MAERANSLLALNLTLGTEKEQAKTSKQGSKCVLCVQVMGTELHDKEEEWVGLELLTSTRVLNVPRACQVLQETK